MVSEIKNKFGNSTKGLLKYLIVSQDKGMLT